MYEIFEQLLKRFGVSSAEVCRATGIGQSTISNWKSRRNLISGKNAQLIADFFNVSVDYLMTGKEKEGEESYYFDDDAREMAQFLFENPEYKVLFDASRKVSKEDIATVKAIMDRFGSNT